MNQKIKTAMNLTVHLPVWTVKVLLMAGWIVACLALLAALAFASGCASGQAQNTNAGTNISAAAETNPTNQADQKSDGSGYVIEDTATVTVDISDASGEE